MNSIYKLLSLTSNLKNIRENDEIEVSVFLAIAHDGSMPKLISTIEEDISNLHNLNFEKLHVTIDHYIPAPSIKARENFFAIKNFSHKYGVNLYSNGEGIIHQVIAEKYKEQLQDKITIGIDGHMSTQAGIGALAFTISPEEMIYFLKTGKYKLKVPAVINIKLIVDKMVSGKDAALYLISKIRKEQIVGKGIIIYTEGLNLSSSKKMTIGNMLSEVGAKTVYFDNEPGNNGDFIFNTSLIPNLIIEPITEAIKDIKDFDEKVITQVYIGGCTNGRIDDIEDIVKVLEGKNVNTNTTLIVCPASRFVANLMDIKGYSNIIRDSGGIIINPGCGACSGIHQGVISKDDIIVTTTPRNSSGRMGDANGKIYITSPMIAAKIAVEGKIGF